MESDEYTNAPGALCRVRVWLDGAEAPDDFFRKAIGSTDFRVGTRQVKPNRSGMMRLFDGDSPRDCSASNDAEGYSFTYRCSEDADGDILFDLFFNAEQESAGKRRSHSSHRSPQHPVVEPQTVRNAVIFALIFLAGIAVGWTVSRLTATDLKDILDSANDAREAPLLNDVAPSDGSPIVAVVVGATSNSTTAAVAAVDAPAEEGRQWLDKIRNASIEFSEIETCLDWASNNPSDANATLVGEYATKLGQVRQLLRDIPKMDVYRLVQTAYSLNEECKGTEDLRRYRVLLQKFCVPATVDGHEETREEMVRRVQRLVARVPEITSFSAAISL